MPEVFPHGVGHLYHPLPLHAPKDVVEHLLEAVKVARVQDLGDIDKEGNVQVRLKGLSMRLSQK